MFGALQSSGDIFPFILIGEHMARRGHKVYSCTNRSFKRLAESRRLNFISVGSTQEYIVGGIQERCETEKRPWIPCAATC